MEEAKSDNPYEKWKHPKEVKEEVEVEKEEDIR